MVTEEGIVIKIEDHFAWVKSQRTSACASCSERDACHTLGGGKDMEVQAVNSANAKVGDTVMISFESAAMFKLSFLLYIFPVLCMIAGAVIGEKLAAGLPVNPSAMAAVFAFAFFGLAFLIIRMTGKKMEKNKQYRAVVFRIKHKNHQKIMNEGEKP